MDIAQTRDRSGSVNSRDAVVVASTSAGTTPTNSLDNQLYDKYQARFFNPLHAKPNGEGVAPNETLSPKGILYDIEGKFAYSTYNEEMRSYHPMLDIKALTKDLKWKKEEEKTPSILKKKGNQTACVVDLEI